MSGTAAQNAIAVVAKLLPEKRPRQPLSLIIPRRFYRRAKKAWASRISIRSVSASLVNSANLRK